MPLSRVAPVALIAWATAGLAVGEVYPFSRFRMYAAPPAGPTAVPVFQAGGVDADPRRYRDFLGLEGDWGTPPAPCTMGYRVDQLRHQVATSRGREPGPVKVALGWRVIGPDGTVGDFLPVAEGTAWPQ